MPMASETFRASPLVCTPTPKSGEIYVRIRRKFGVGRSSFPAAISGEYGDLNLKNGNVINYGIKMSNLD
jgi:hypothetical protein